MYKQLWSKETDKASFISTVKTAGPKGPPWKRRIPARRTYKLFRKAVNFCQGIGQKKYGRLFPRLLLKHYTCPNEPGSKRSKDSCLVPLGVFCNNIHAYLHMPTKVNIKNDVISRRVRQFGNLLMLRIFPTTS